jgi:probable rRNA maturation factor
MISVMVRSTVRGRVNDGTIRRRAGKLLELLGKSEADLAIVLTDDLEIQELNAQWRQIDSPTDVLSFPQQEGEDFPQIPGFEPPLGDIVISLERAAKQATEDGCLPRLWPVLGSAQAPESWTLLDETTFLLIHGVLHLLGHDHMEPEEAAEMEAKEAELLPLLLKGRR